MRVFDGKSYRDMTPSEIAAAERAEAEHWKSIPYADAVIAKIRERYSLEDELALLRQMFKKPDEFAAYAAYCEECKEFVKAKKGVN